jgi:hypothetical protein
VPDWQFYRHMPVYLQDGRRLGRVEEIGHAVEVLHVQQGRVLVQDWYIPLSAVRNVSPQGVTLHVSRKELGSHGWNVPTEEYLARQGATPGYEYTNYRDGLQDEGQSADAEGEESNGQRV